MVSNISASTVKARTRAMYTLLWMTFVSKQVVRRAAVSARNSFHLGGAKGFAEVSF